MTATHTADSTPSNAPVLYLAFDLGLKTWKLAFSVGMGQKPRLRTIPAGDLTCLEDEIKAAKKRFGLPDDARVLSCYEAGRDGFWLHRFLTQRGVSNQVVDSSSIEVNRRKRRAKSDRLDASKLLVMLIRFHNGERKVWCAVHVPGVAQEAGRQRHRELLELKTERTGHVNRIKGLVAALGLSIVVDDKLPARLEGLRQWDESPVPPELKQRVLREFERWKLVDGHIRELDRQRRQEVRTSKAPEVEKVRRLMRLKGVGSHGAWILVHEFFGWRRFRNRRQVGSLAGLTPTPYGSGETEHEQGISKAGNPRVRWLMIELAWCWLRYQPESELSRWYRRRFGEGGARQRRIGIVALARKLLIAFWRYLEFGEVPDGAQERDPEGEPTRAAVGARKAS